MLHLVSSIPHIRRSSDVTDATPRGHPRYTSNHVHTHGSMLLDLAGRVTYCCASAATLAGRSVADIVGTQIKSLLPDLPIRENTPGYNIAVSESLCGRWQPLCLPNANGVAETIEASMQHLAIGRVHSLLLQLRWPIPGARRDRRTHARRQPPQTATARWPEREMSAKKIVAFVLAGGEGRRLMPLTAACPKPALPFGGYRLIDFALSNLCNSQIRSIYVLAQYCPLPLLRHVAQAWVPQPAATPDFVRALLPREHGGCLGYKGTADSVRQNLRVLDRLQPDIVAVFAADHVYRMDVR